MRVDRSLSVHREDPAASREFNRAELKMLRQVLRRLRFLEQQVRNNGGLDSADASGGAAFAELEADALEYVLTEIGFLLPRD